MMTTYWVTWVHVTARIPPKKEQTNTPPKANKIPISKWTPVKREVINPTPYNCATT